MELTIFVVVGFHIVRELLNQKRNIRHGIVICDMDSNARENYEVTSLHQAIDFKTQRLAIMGV